MQVDMKTGEVKTNNTNRPQQIPVHKKPATKKQMKAEQKHKKNLKRKIKKKLKQRHKQELKGNPATQPVKKQSKEQARRVTKNEIRRRKRNRKIISTAVVMFLILLGFILSVIFIFKITEFRIEGNSIYTEQEIIDALEIPLESNIFSFSTNEKENLLFKEMIYFEDIEVRRRLPNTVVVNVVGAVESYAVADGNGYVILSQGLKVLRSTDELPQGVCLIQGLELETKVLGETVTATTPEQQELLIKLLQEISQTSLMPVTHIDITSDYDISFVSDNRLKVVLGAGIDTKYKLDLVEKVVQDELLPDQKATLDASSASTTKSVWVNVGDF